jgi:hypothetical protein
MNEVTLTDKSLRSCATCACHTVRPHPFNPVESVHICRRNQANLAQAQGEIPRMDAKGLPVMGKDGKPIMERVNKQIYVYAATAPDSVCFDGWRPLDTLPGDKASVFNDAAVKDMMRLMEPILNALGIFRVKETLDG